MISMKFDKEAFNKLVKELEEELPKQMEYIINLGAMYERVNHAYQNRTGNLERSTKAVWQRKSSQELRMNLEMGAYYASFIRKMGLSSIDVAAARTREALDDYFQSITKKYYG